jgi:small subunit ribosomal protein S6
MNHYETVFILTPVLSEAQMKEAVKDYEKYLKKDMKAQIVNNESWGMRKLAYPINKKSSGFYHLFEFQADPSLIADLEVKFKRDERIMRFLSVKLDKHAVAWAEKRKNRKSGKSAEVEA